MKNKFIISKIHLYKGTEVNMGKALKQLIFVRRELIERISVKEFISITFKEELPYKKLVEIFMTDIMKKVD